MNLLGNYHRQNEVIVEEISIFYICRIEALGCRKDDPDGSKSYEDSTDIVRQDVF